ncbi:MAG: hypothetical protein PVF40_02220 [Ectothiorhodospiraceae bacterium]|jgi:hypothetical protein
MAAVAIRDLESSPARERRRLAGGSRALEAAYVLGRRVGYRRMLAQWLYSQPFTFAQQTAVAVSTPDFKYAYIQQTAFAFGTAANITQQANLFDGGFFGAQRIGTGG